MVPDRGEIGEVRAKDGIDLPVPARGIIVVVEIPLMQHGIGAFVFDQPEGRLGVRTQPLVADESDREVDRRQVALRPNL